MVSETRIYAVAATVGLAATAGVVATGVVSSGLVSSAAAGAGVASAGFSDFLPFTVPMTRDKNGDFGFSPSSSLVEDLSFFDNHGRELLRLSVLVTGDSVALVSPLVTAGVVSVGTVAGEATEVANGSVDSTAGITGAVSLTGSGSTTSLAGTTGASSFLTFESETYDLNVPKMLLRFLLAGLVSATAGVVAVSSTGAVGSTGARGSIAVSAIGSVIAASVD